MSPLMKDVNGSATTLIPGDGPAPIGLPADTIVEAVRTSSIYLLQRMS